jgi:hypothetical protein
MGNTFSVSYLINQVNRHWRYKIFLWHVIPAGPPRESEKYEYLNFTEEITIKPIRLPSAVRSDVFPRFVVFFILHGIARVDICVFPPVQFPVFTGRTDFDAQATG